MIIVTGRIFVKDDSASFSINGNECKFKLAGFEPEPFGGNVDVVLNDETILFTITSPGKPEKIERSESWVNPHCLDVVKKFILNQTMV